MFYKENLSISLFFFPWDFKGQLITVVIICDICSIYLNLCLISLEALISHCEWKKCQKKKKKNSQKNEKVRGWKNKTKNLIHCGLSLLTWCGKKVIEMLEKPESQLIRKKFTTGNLHVLQAKQLWIPKSPHFVSLRRTFHSGQHCHQLSDYRRWILCIEVLHRWLEMSMSGKLVEISDPMRYLNMVVSKLF